MKRQAEKVVVGVRQFMRDDATDVLARNIDMHVNDRASVGAVRQVAPQSDFGWVNPANGSSLPSSRRTLAASMRSSWVSSLMK